MRTETVKPRRFAGFAGFGAAATMLVCMAVGAGAALAGAPTLPDPDARSPLLQFVDITDTASGIPVYDKENDTFYQLVSVKKFWPNRYRNDGVTWAEASRLAFGLTHEGRLGRLAVVDSPEIHSFLRKNFPIDREAWIGLRYWCHFKKLTWIDGASHKLSEFQVWGSPWTSAVRTVSKVRRRNVRRTINTGACITGGSNTASTGMRTARRRPIRFSLSSIPPMPEDEKEPESAPETPAS